jgi:hypothetical protein
VQGRTGLPIGMIEEQTPCGLGPTTGGPGGYLVTVAERPECGRVARLLLLAATLSLDIVYRDRVGADPKPDSSNRSGSRTGGSLEFFRWLWGEMGTSPHT